jgi:hypothetical protein
VLIFNSIHEVRHDSIATRDAECYETRRFSFVNPHSDSDDCKFDRDWQQSWLKGRFQSGNCGNIRGSVLDSNAGSSSCSGIRPQTADEHSDQQMRMLGCGCRSLPRQCLIAKVSQLIGVELVPELIGDRRQLVARRTSGFDDGPELRGSLAMSAHRAGASTVDVGLSRVLGRLGLQLQSESQLQRMLC